MRGLGTVSSCWWTKFSPRHECKKHRWLKSCRKLEKTLKLPKVWTVSAQTRNGGCRQLPPTQIALSHAAEENPQRLGGGWLAHAQLILSLSIWDLKFLHINRLTSFSFSQTQKANVHFGDMRDACCVFTQSDSQRTRIQRTAACKEGGVVTDSWWKTWASASTNWRRQKKKNLWCAHVSAWNEALTPCSDLAVTTGLSDPIQSGQLRAQPWWMSRMHVEARPEQAGSCGVQTWWKWWKVTLLLSPTLTSAFDKYWTIRPQVQTSLRRQPWA